PTRMSDTARPLLQRPTPLTWPRRRAAPRQPASAFAGAEADAWRSALLVGVAAFVVSRILVFGAIYARAAQDVWERYTRGLPFSPSMRPIMEQVLTQWDRRRFRMSAEAGYPRTIPERLGTMRGTGATTGSLPLVAWVGRAFDVVWPGDIDQALIALMVPVSLAAVVLVGLLA